MLRDVQGAFAASLLAGDTAAAPLIHGGKIDAARRLAVYRHNVFTNLRGALGDIYPIVKRVVGDAFFLHAADEYIRAHPSLSGDLNQFGAAWPAFLADYPHAVELPYLADVARLEWCWHECFHEAESPPLDLSRLAAVPEEAHGDLIFRLHPAARLHESTFPILRVWQVNQADYAGEMEIDWARRGDSLLVSRDHANGVEVVIESLAPAAYRFLHELAQQRTLEAAAAAAMDTDAAFDLQGFLIESVQSGVIVDFSKDR